MEERAGQKYESKLGLQIYCCASELTNPRPALALRFLSCYIINALFIESF